MTEGFGRGRWKPTGGEEGQAGEDADMKRITDMGTKPMIPMPVVIRYKI